MGSVAERSLAHPPLTDALSSARRRWRLRHAAVGSAIALGAVLMGFWITAVVLEQLRFTPVAITGARIAMALLVVGVVGRWVLFPLLRRVPDSRLALYLEERVRGLGGAVLSAVEVSSASASDDARSPS